MMLAGQQWKDVLPGEREMSAELGVSRVTVVSDDMTVEGLRRALRSVLNGNDPPTVLMLSSVGQLLPVLGIFGN